MQRPKEEVWIETDAGRFSAFSSIEVSLDIFGEAQAIFEVGDDRAWRTVHRLLYPSAGASILVNGCPVFTGRIDWVQLSIGQDSHDHLIRPEDRLRLAMGKQ